MTWPQLVEFAKSVSAVIGCVVCASGFLLSIGKPLRKRIGKAIRQAAAADESKAQAETIEAALLGMQTELSLISDKLSRCIGGSRASLGNSIKHIYFKFLPNKQIPYREKEAVIMLHDAYKALGGNHGVDEIYEEIMNWEVI